MTEKDLEDRYDLNQSRVVNIDNNRTSVIPNTLVQAYINALANTPYVLHFVLLAGDSNIFA